MSAYDLVIHTDGSVVHADQLPEGRCSPTGIGAWSWVDSEGRWAAGPSVPSRVGSYSAEAQAVLAAVNMAPPGASLLVMCDNQAVVEDMPSLVRRPRGKGKRSPNAIRKTPSPTSNKVDSLPMHYWADALARRASAMLVEGAMPEHVVGGWLPTELLGLRARWIRRRTAIVASMPHEELGSLDHLAMPSMMFDAGLLHPDGEPSARARRKGRSSGTSMYHAAHGWDALALFERFFPDGFDAGVGTHHRIRGDKP